MQHASFRAFNEATTREGQIALVLVEGFSQLDLACVLEPLRHANAILGRDFFKWRILSASGTSVRSSLGIDVQPSGSLSDLAAEEILVLLAGVNPSKQETERLLPSLRRENAHGRRIIGVFGAALVLAKSGLLDGVECAVHWQLAPGITTRSPKVRALASAYQTGRIATAAGGTAAADLILTEVSRTLGPDVAAQVADLMVHHAVRPAEAPQTASFLGTVSKRNQKLARVVALMESHIETPIETPALAEAAGLSVRQMERLFMRYFETSPNAFYVSIRLNRARDLLQQTDLSVEEVAGATGFSGATHFSKRYRQAFGTSAYRAVSRA